MNTCTICLRGVLPEYFIRCSGQCGVGLCLRCASECLAQIEDWDCVSCCCDTPDVVRDKPCYRCGVMSAVAAACHGKGDKTLCEVCAGLLNQGSDWSCDECE